MTALETAENEGAVVDAEEALCGEASAANEDPVSSSKTYLLSLSLPSSFSFSMSFFFASVFYFGFRPSSVPFSIFPFSFSLFFLID